MISERNETRYNDQLADITNNGLRTKAQQKDFISRVNRILEDFYGAANRQSQDIADERSDVERDAYFKMKWSLPCPVMVHQYDSAIKKYKKAAEKDAVFGAFVTHLELADKYVRQALAVKAMKVTPRKTRSETEREAHEARWKKLPKASKETVEAIISSVTAPIELRHENRKSFMLLTREGMLKELRAITCNKTYSARRNELRKEFGGSLFDLLNSSVLDIEKVLDEERLGEFRKIRYASTQRLGEYDIDSAVNTHIQSGADGVECDFSLLKNGVQVGVFGFKAIFAGGYNIQRLHTRTIFNDKKVGA